MEYSIDRTCYRRRQEKTVDELEEKSIVIPIIKRLIIQFCACGILFLIAYTIKVMSLQPALSWLECEINKEVPVNVAFEEIKDTFHDLYDSFNTFTAKIEESKVNDEADKAEINTSTETEILEPILSINTDIPTEPIFEEAVEGVNQMSEDAAFVKANYNLIYPIYGQVTSEFGVRTSDNPIVTSYHSGIDLAADKGTKIKAALSGKVITVATIESYGQYLMIQTDNVVTLYAHCSKILVKEGQKINQGDYIAEVGSTGWATGPHLHFEIRVDGRLVNPNDVLDFGDKYVY